MRRSRGAEAVGSRREKKEARKIYGNMEHTLSYPTVHTCTHMHINSIYFIATNQSKSA